MNGSNVQFKMSQASNTINITILNQMLKIFDQKKIKG